MFKGRPGDGKAVVGGGATADFVQDHQRAVVGLVQDGGGFDHFDHEGRPAPRKVVRCADPAEKLGDEADAGLGGRDVGSGLGKEGYEGILAQEGGFAGHVRAGQQPDRGGVLVGELAIVGDEGLAVAS